MEKAEKPKTPEQNELALADFIRSKLKGSPNSISITLDFNELSKHLSLTDFDALGRRLGKLKKALGNDFEFGVLSHGRITSVDDTDMRHLPQVPYAYKIILEDRKALDGHIAALKAKVEVQVEDHQFILTELTAGTSSLALVGSLEEPLVIRHHSLRYKVLRLLAEAKKKMQTRNIVDSVNLSVADTKKVNEDNVRGAVEEVRTRIEKEFKIPREALFENDQSGDGYLVDNVQLK